MRIYDALAFSLFSPSRSFSCLLRPLLLLLLFCASSFFEIATTLSPHRLSCSSCCRCCSYASTALRYLLLLSAFRAFGPGLGTDVLAQSFDTKEDEVRIKAPREEVRSSQRARILMLQRPGCNDLRVEVLGGSFSRLEHLNIDLKQSDPAGFLCKRYLARGPHIARKPPAHSRSTTSSSA